MLKRSMVAAGLLLPLLQPAAANGQRTRGTQPQVGPPVQHDHTLRSRDLVWLEQVLSLHGRFLSRFSTDHAFGDRLETAADQGDTGALAQLFAQATGLPLGSIRVKPAGTTGLGARGSEPGFRVEEAVLRARARSLRPQGTAIGYCIRGWCIWIRRETTEDG